MQQVKRYWLALICLLAAGMSFWLTAQKLSGNIDSLAGCGAAGSCANLLGGKWSVVFGVVPVSLLSSFLYVFVLISLWVRYPWVKFFRRLSAWLCIFAAIWFTCLQAFVLKSFCPYCMTMHGLGVLLGLSILLLERESNAQRNRTLGFMDVIVAAVMVSALAIIQHFGPTPRTYRVDQVSIDNSGLSLGRDEQVSSGRVVQFFDGKKTYHVEELPHLGSVNAKHVIVEYFDYTCSACRDLHQLLDHAIKEHPDDLAVIVLPVPLNSDCNPYLPQGVEEHENACALARLALKVWYAAPSQFAEFHQNLFKFHEMPLEAAEAMAMSLVGEEKWRTVDDAQVENLLKRNLEDYRLFVKKTPVLPKLLLKGSVMVQGKIADQASLDELLEKYLKIKK